MIKALLPKTLNDWLFLIIVLASFTGFILSVISFFKICSKVCSEVHNWRLFGMPFEYFGGLFFIPLLTFLTLSKKYPKLLGWSGLMLAGATGAEIKFILLQKYQICSWCPICLSIAACIFIAFAAFIIKYGTEMKTLFRQGLRGEIMNGYLKGFAGFSLLVLGFLIATVGCTRFNPLEAAENTIKESLAFGKRESPIEVYLFTDWACPACRELEPDIEKMAPAIMEKGTLTFVDHAIHTETLNYSPYNVSFAVKNKPQYFRLREGLTELSAKTDSPTDEQIEKIAAKEGIKYQQLNFADITLSQKYFKQLAKQFGVSKTPTMVIINAKTKKGKKLIGVAEITESNVLKAIDSLEK